MKRLMTIAALAAMLAPVAASSGTVYTRAWCKNPAHGRNPQGGYGWISETFSGPDSTECWRFANGHSQVSGHEAGCSYVRADGTY